VPPGRIEAVAFRKLRPPPTADWPFPVNEQSIRKLAATAATAFSMYAVQSQAAVGDLYVTNSGNDTVVRITPSGTVLPVPMVGLSQPHGIAFDRSGNLFVSNIGDNTILKLSIDGVTSVFASTGLDGPRGLAFDSSGNLYVANANSNSIERFAPDGTGSLFASTNLDFPRGIAFNAAGDLFVVNSGSQNVVRFTPAGVGSIFIPGGISYPLSLAFDTAGNLFVSRQLDEIDRFTPSGLGGFPLPTNNSHMPYGLAFDSAGVLYAGYRVSGTVERFTSPRSSSVFDTTGLSVPTFIAFEGVTLPVPEPSTGALIAIAMVGWSGNRRVIRRRQSRQSFV